MLCVLLKKLRLTSFNLIYYQKIKVHKWTAASVRESFLSFYKGHDHSFIPSSPVVPWNDASIEFTNAGMNQFKSSILGQRKFPVDRATNSQKCIRVGGKHNDLLDVGRDTYHHTFFEMLGNWSFNNYFKEEACKMSWELLTKVYKIPTQHLYVTYFGGDRLKKIEKDEETKNIWLKIGVPKERIIPFGMKDNFWEMGKVGPCGVSTEIHYEREPSENGAVKVNQGNEDVIEIWNIVFIQYQRLTSGELIPLGNKFVDTGMGLERITACLNGKRSNYDTDLFIPLLNEIEKISGNQPYGGTFNYEDGSIDTFYRILADHSRMIAVSLADGFLPHQSEVLRKLIRKCFLIGWNNFNLSSQKNFMEILVRSVTDVLGDTYPELRNNFNKIKAILDYEEELLKESQLKFSKDWQSLIEEFPPALNITNISSTVIEALQYFLSNRSKWEKELPLEEALHIIYKFSLSESTFREIIEILGLNLNLELLHTSLNETKLKQKDSSSHYQILKSDIYSKLKLNKISDTVNHAHNYSYSSDKGYIYENHNTHVRSIISEDNLVENIRKGNKGILVLDSTIFYPTSGGQLCDNGFIECNGSNFKVSRVEKLEDYVLHYGEVLEGHFNKGSPVKLSINKGFRLSTSRLHTVHHLLRAAIEAVSGMAYQMGSSVTSNNLTFEVFVYPPLSYEQLLQAENIVKFWIKAGKDVNRRTIPLMDALRIKNLALVSHSKYPEVVHVISSEYDLPSEMKKFQFLGANPKITSTELCCGTHVFNTGHIGDFAIKDVKRQSKGNTLLTAVIGKEALMLNENGKILENEWKPWKEKVTRALDQNDKLMYLKNDFKKWKNQIKKSRVSAPFFYSIEENYNDLLEQMDRIILVESNWEKLRLEFLEYLKSNPMGPVIYEMKNDYKGPLKNLETIMEDVSGRPAVFICKGWGKIRACVYLPENMQKQNITLESLLKEISMSVGKGDISYSTNSKEIGFFHMVGVKRDQIDSIKSSIICSSRKKLNIINCF